MNQRVSGFTLVEVVISLAVLAIAFFGLISVITYTTRMNMATKERMLAMRAAEKKIEQMSGCATFDEIFTTYSQQIEGLGWEQVEGLLPVEAIPLPGPADPGYPAAPTKKAVLYVRFPWNATRSALSEPGSGKFMDNKDAFGNFVDLDLNRNNTTTSASDASVLIGDCKLLPVTVEVHWKSSVGPTQSMSLGSTSLIYRYTFLRRT